MPVFSANLFGPFYKEASYKGFDESDTDTGLFWFLKKKSFISFSPKVLGWIHEIELRSKILCDIFYNDATFLIWHALYILLLFAWSYSYTVDKKGLMINREWLRNDKVTNVPIC